MQLSPAYKVFRAFNYVFLFIISLATFIPFYLVVVVSFTLEKSISLKGYQLFPRQLSFAAYEALLSKGSRYIDAYKVSVTITVIGTFFAVLITCLLAYAISRKHLRYRNHIAFFVYFTLIFNGGLVPWYIIVGKLGIKDSLLGLILPLLVNAFNVFLIRNYFRAIPDAILESATIDGSGELRTFFRIVLPLALPGLATITLFYMLAYWNEWFVALMLINTKELYPLQFLLRQILSTVLYAASAKSQITNIGELPAEGIKMATVVLTVGPIIFVYPFIQKYFIKGLVVGAVKG
ncbi:carbohydrate ABC transporter permease [Paenibacillus psychroresistens]|uniref:Carbohydrate ABC transporter permease n=1 Tax=Paenibacillus psychroresistens TaxID=1778678 RepID=A0A6B8RU02_9BACL|nr:carbohydrate ABC transporter permease [Paenibacillus psychroresistens]QGQ99397.1 carbohydrate ABC transporter permease [Paenibacillus psychroresistens]